MYRFRNRDIVLRIDSEFGRNRFLESIPSAKWGRINYFFKEKREKETMEEMREKFAESADKSLFSWTILTIKKVFCQLTAVWVPWSILAWKLSILHAGGVKLTFEIHFDSSNQCLESIPESILESIPGVCWESRHYLDSRIWNRFRNRFLNSWNRTPLLSCIKFSAIHYILFWFCFLLL